MARMNPSGTRYGDLLPLGFRARAQVRHFQPNNGTTFSYGTSNQIRIPLQSSGFLDTKHSYIKLTVQAGTIPGSQLSAGGQSSSPGQMLDSSVHSLITRMRIEGSDGQELERIDGYNVLAAMLKDASIGMDHDGSVGSFSGGRAGSTYFSAVSDQPSLVYNSTATVDTLVQVYCSARLPNGRAMTFQNQIAIPAYNNALIMGTGNTTGLDHIVPGDKYVLPVDASQTGTSGTFTCVIPVGALILYGGRNSQGVPSASNYESEYGPTYTVRNRDVIVLTVTKSATGLSFPWPANVVYEGDFSLNNSQSYGHEGEVFAFNNEAKTFCFRPVSGLLNNDRFLPLQEIKGGGITLELTLENPEVAFVVFNKRSGEAAYTITKCEYIAHIVEFDEEFNVAFRQAVMKQAIQFHGVSFRRTPYQMQAGTTSVTVPIADRLRSLKCLLAGIRPAATLSTAWAHGTSDRITNNLSSIQFRVGAQIFPTQPILYSPSVVDGLVTVNVSNAWAPSAVVSLGSTATNVSEVPTELLKAFSRLGDVSYAWQLDRNTIQSNPSNCIVDSTTTVTQAGAKVFHGNFMFGFDFEQYPQDSSLLESGMNTASQNLPVYMELTFSTTNGALNTAVGEGGNTTGTTVQAMIDTYSVYDVLYTLQNGILSALI